MKRSYTRFWLGVGILFLTGCASSGRFNSALLTNVELSGKNYRVVATNVHGEASAGYLLGFSYGQFGEMTTLALIPISKQRLLYKMAIEALWKNFEKTYGPVAGRSLALVNVRFDADAQNFLLLYTRPKISVRADVIEFVE